MAEEPADTPRPLAEISHGPSAFEAFLDRNQKGMIALGVALVVATAGWIVVRGVKDKAEKDAGGQLVKATEISDLQALLKDHPDTAAAGSAQVVIAGKQWDAGDQDAAVETLQAFLSSKPDHPAAVTAKASLATRLMQQGKKDEAAAMFRELADDPQARFIAPYALASLGDLHKAAGKLDEAEQAYKRAQNDFGTNPFANLAGQRLKLLRFELPAEIDPPPAPAPTEGSDVPETDPAEDAALPQELEGPLGDILSGGGETAPAGTPEESPPAEQPAAPAEETAPPAEAPEEPATEGNSH